ncbi:Casparian strip membrane protein 5, putative isoform 1 [Hibiscus syriacus]|uniref:Casparian strip membrane protein 5, putative isoform 1 n=1 Tax=Hibiscus syriacus TaxID=106335 RepID=A0A6A3CCJ5_HIBSY|nr:Casparian strip membrane protein 5, putative isoform 1 [Hibiscus syriacus]
MSSFTNSTFSIHVNHNFPTSQNHQCSKLSLPVIRVSDQPQQSNAIDIGNRRRLVTTFLAISLAALGQQGMPVAAAEHWGTHSFLGERFFEPGFSPEDTVARIKQTAEGLRSMRDMLDTTSRRKDVYVKTANELVDNMAEFNYYIRTSKVYESYLYKEKTLKSIDDLAALLG